MQALTARLAQELVAPALALKTWLISFLFTQAVEIPVYRRVLPCGSMAASLPTLITHPLLWFALFPALRGSYWQRVAIGEALVVVAETLIALALLLRAAAPRHPGNPLARSFGVALLANVASAGVGLLSRHYLGVP